MKSKQVATLNNPLVSVIITCYNYGEYVEESIRSVWDQTYKNVELIVINDGSTDDSDQVIRALTIERGFRYIAQDNAGIIVTRNKGMSLAKGDFVMQLDADDWLDKTYIEKCVGAAVKYDAGIVYTQVRIFGRAEFTSTYIDFDLEKLKHDNYIHATALIRKELLSDTPYDVYLNDKGYEDWDLFLGLCLAGASAKLVDEPLLHYRKHAVRKSRSDDFASVYKEMLVRHHLWNKYNDKYPEQFWYFSSQINGLLEMIQIYNDYAALQEAVKLLETQKQTLARKVTRLEARDAVSIAKKTYRKIRKTK